MRKKICLMVMVMCYAAGLFGQTNVYQPFPDSGAVWRLRSEVTCTIGFSPCITEYQYVSKGDTLLNGTRYIKVYYEAFETQCSLVAPNVSVCGTPYFHSYLFSTIRNDTLLKKVFSGNGITESVLYDFSLGIGDSMKGACNQQVITGIDSILIDNNYRKRFILDNGNYVIEGIGVVWDQLTNGFFADPFATYCGNPCICNFQLVFDCFSQNGVTVFPDTSTCTIINSINETKNPLSFIIYPNPTSSRFTITNASIIDKIEITDMIRQVIYRATPKDKNFMVQMERDGIYFVTLTAQNGSVTKKVVVQH